MEEKRRFNKNRSGVTDVIAAGVGIALFVVLTTFQIPVKAPNTFIQPRMAVLAFLSAAFGPLVGVITGVFGHILGDAIFYHSVYWSWVFPEAIIGIAIGMYSPRFDLGSGSFNRRDNIILFNAVQVIANAIAWVIVAPLLDIFFYAEPVVMALRQGVFGFLGNIVIVGVFGTAALSVYSALTGGRKETGSS